MTLNELIDKLRTLSLLYGECHVSLQSDDVVIYQTDDVDVVEDDDDEPFVLIYSGSLK
jgi:hypothetical protein